MTINYYSNLISRSKFTEIFGYGTNTPGQQAQRFNRLISQGLSEYFSVQNYSFPPITKANSDVQKVVLKDEFSDGLNFHYFPVYNIPFVRNLSAFSVSKDTVKGADFVVCDLLSASISYGALLGARKKNIKTLGIITDIPDFLTGKAGSASFKKLFQKNLNLCDGYVLLTKEMAPYLQINKKPLCIVEGVVDVDSIGGNFSNDAVEKIKDTNNFLMLYAGGLEPSYGIIELINSVLNLQNCKLLIYGNGSIRSQILDFSDKHPDKINYLGVASNDDVIKAEKEVDLLINPRPGNQEFTKFSFPSKNLEYMSSGTPILCYKLSGIPDEYDDYYYHIGSDLTESIKEIMAKPSVELANFGAKSKAFVAENKNKTKQAEKIKNLLLSL